MAYKTIVAHFERETSVQGPLLKTAAALAEAHGAHLIGVVVLPSFYKMPPDAASAMAPMDTIRDQARLSGSRMQEVFEARLRASTITFEWRIIDPGFRDTIQAVADLGNAADLIIAEQDLRGEHDEGLRDGLGLLAVTTGRPVLLVPALHSVRTPPERVVVAWDASRAATRALFDALPLLQPPAHVTLLGMRTTNEFDGPEFLARTMQASDISDALSRHGITCTTAVEIAGGNGIGREMLSYATAHQADLLVIGGYGHSRLREWMFGGVTRTILRESPIPVLLSH